MKKTRILDGIIAFISAVAIILFVNALLFLKLGIAGMAITEGLLVFVPLCIILLRKESLAQRFNLRLPSISSFFSAVVLMMGASMWENAASYIYIALFGMPESNDTVFLEQYFGGVNPAVVLIVIAIVPAVCEELLFRGYLFNSFKGKRTKVWAVIITSVLFSAIHFDLYKAMPIFIMALAFGYITAKTDSVIIPMIFHLINNSMGVISFYTTRGQDTEAILESVSDSTYIWYAVAALGMGLILIYFGTRLLSGKPRKKWQNILVPIVSGALATIGIFGIMLSMMSMPYVNSYKAFITEDTTFTESFTVEEDCYGVISVSAVSSTRQPCLVTVTDPEGEEIYNSDNTVSGSLISMPEGEYTVTYSFEYGESKNTAVKSYVKADVVVITTTAVTETSFGSV